MKRGVPFCFLNVLIYWYLNLRCRCQWQGILGDYFPVSTGVRQGGVLSPQLFAVYVDDLINILRSRGIGCHILNTFLACLFFADDLCLISPTRSAMQELLDICFKYCEEINLSFNDKKSKTLVFNMKPNHFIKPLSLNGCTIEIVNEWKYLGTTIISGKNFSFSAKKELRSFYASFNSLYNAKIKPDEPVMMKLLYSTCLPILTYASDVKFFSTSEMQSCQTAVNNAIRRIFGYNRWESIRQLRQKLGYKDLTTIFHSRKETFLRGALTSGNHVVRFLANL